MSLLRAMPGRFARAVTRARNEIGARTVVDSRFPHKPLRLYQTKLGPYYLPSDAKSDCIAAEMRVGRVFEPEVVEASRRYVRPGTTVLDVGSNFGQMALLFAEMVGEHGQVLAFEADDFVHAVLRRNLDVQHADNVRAYLAAVYDQSGKDVFYPLQDFEKFSAYGSYGIDPNATRGRSIRTLAIDDLQIEEPISFMKVDIQGSDLFALRGAARTIERHRMPILFEYEEQFQQAFNTCFQDYLDLFRALSYRIDKTIRTINYLAVPNERTVIPVQGLGQSQSNEAPRSLEGRGAGTKATEPASESHAPFQQRMCSFLKTKEEVEASTAFLHQNGYTSHVLSCKDWDLAHIIGAVGDGNFLDMGSSESYILKNLVLKRTSGEKYGIDLRAPDVPLRGVRYLIGDLMDVPIESGFFQNITCLSVIEHQVDPVSFAQEAARLLKPGGRLFVTFDYWEPAVRPRGLLYGLTWQPLDKAALMQFIHECERAGLHLVEDMDWTLGEQVIREGYYSPERNIRYTFGLVTFEKREARSLPV